MTVKCRIDYVHNEFLPRDAMHKRGICRHAVFVCPSVCLSVTFVDHVKTNKHIFKMFPPSGSHTILVFPYQTAWRYSVGNPLNGGVECKGYENQPPFLSRVSILTRDIDIANLSVCPSVSYVTVLDENGLTYRHSFFTIR